MPRLSAQDANPAVSRRETRVSVNTDHEIARILGSILVRWQDSASREASAEPEALTQPSPAVQPNADGDYEETVILTDDSEKTVVIPAPVEKATPTDSEQTVIMSPRPLAGDFDSMDVEKTMVVEPRPEAGQQAGLEKTVLIRQIPDGQEQALEKTVVMGPPGRPATRSVKAHRIQGQNADREQIPPAENEPQATIVIQPNHMQNRNHR
jgi:hypothetical protein